MDAETFQVKGKSTIHASVDFGALFASTPGLCLALLPDDPIYTIVAITNAYARAIAIDPSQVVGRSLLGVFPDQATVVNSLHASLRRVLTTKTSDAMTVQKIGIRTQEGAYEERYLNFLNTPVFDPHGCITGLIHCAEDLTESMRKSEKLQEIEHMFQAFVNVTSDVVYRMSADWSEMVYLSGRGFIEDTRDLSRTWLARYIHPDDQAYVLLAIEKAICTKTPFEMEHRVIRADGTLGTTYSRAIPILDAQGHIVEWFGTARDVSASKEAGNALERMTAYSDQQRRFYDAILSSTPDLVYVFDLQHRFTFANKALLDLWGKSWEQAIGKNCLELGYEPWHAAMHDREIDQVIATQKPVRGEVPFTGTQGRRNFDYIFVPVIGAQGQVEAVAGTTRDVTLRAQSESRQKFLLKLSDAIRSLIDPQEVKAEASRVLGEYLMVNRCFYAEVDGEDWVVEGGYSRLGHPLPPGRYSTDTYGQLAMSAYRAGKRIVWRNTAIEPDLSLEERAAHLAISIIGAVGVPLLKDGKLVAILTAHTDEPRDWTAEEIALVEETVERTWSYVQRARAEISLRNSETRFRVLTESMPQLVWTCLPDGRCNYLSSQWVEYTGVAESEQLDLNWLNRVIHPDDRERTREHWLGAVAGHHPYDIEYRIRAANGTYRWFQTRGVPMRDASETIIAWFGTCTDITSQVLARKELERVNKELQQFAYVASHDLQEPLRMVNIFTELIVTQFAPEEPKAQHFAGIVRQGVQRMDSLIRDLLTYSQTVQEEEQPVGTADLSAALLEAQAVLQNRIEESGTIIKSTFLPLVPGDTQQLSYLFQNLLSNAIKYCKPNVKPEIEISSSRSEGNWIISIRDNGIGFEQQYAQRIFGLFKRLHKHQYPGTGVGLAICQRIVERHGGHIWAESSPGKGATFFLSLPDGTNEEFS